MLMRRNDGYILAFTMRIRFGWLPIALLALPLCGMSAFAAPRARPNVVVIMVDTLRADHLGCYGFKGNISPVIDKFAKESVMFERCSSAASWTMPSVVSFLTGLYPERHGVIHAALSDDGRDPKHLEFLSPNIKTMAEIFSANGYRTVGIVANPWLKPESTMGRGYDEYRFIDRETMLESTTDWLKVDSVTVSTAPLFLYVHILDVHGHYQFSEDDFAQMASIVKDGPDRPLTAMEKKEQISWYMKETFRDHPERADTVMNWRAAYAGGVKRFDRHVVSLFDALKTSGLMDSSIVIFTSDHGEGLFERGWLEHGKTVNIEEIQVPLLIRMPGGKQAGRHVRPWVDLVDVLPTLADLCSLQTGGAQMQGISLAPAMNGTPLPERAVFSSTNMRESVQISAIRGNLQLLSFGQRPLKLFDLAADRQEKTDLFPSLPKKAETLRADMDAYVKKPSAPKKKQEEKAPMSDEMREQLRSLGYLQ